jgi:hypothetical protein
MHGERNVDSSGAGGLSSLVVLNETMNRVQVEEGLDEPPAIEDYFDIVAGAGTGGYGPLWLHWTLLTNLVQNCGDDGWEARHPNEAGDNQFRKPCKRSVLGQEDYRAWRVQGVQA